MPYFSPGCETFASKSLLMRNDSDIWSTILKGRRDALRTLFDMYYPSMLNYGLKLVSKKPFIKDCIQDVFLKIWDRRKKLSHVSNVRAYLFTALRMRVIELSQRNNARAKRQYSYAEKLAGELLNVEQIMIKSEIDQEKKKVLKKAVEQLTDRQSEVVYLKFFNGFSNEEIAEIMQITRQSVYNLIYEALKNLEKYLEWFGT